MKLKQLTVPIENSRDRLYVIMRSFSSKGIIPKAITIVDKGDYGELRILVSDLKVARQILMQKGIPGHVDEVIALNISSQSENHAKILKTIMDAGIQIKYCYPHVNSDLGRTIMIYCFSDNEKAIQALSKQHIYSTDCDDLDLLEAAA
jgi:hypothetical protein